MTKQVQRRRGTSTQHTSFTGAEGEISVNTTNKSIHVHDGVTAGGVEAARADMTNVTDANLNARLNGNTLSSLTITSADINGGTIDGTVIGGSTPAAISGTTGSFSGNLAVDTDTLFVDAANNRVGIGTSGPAEPLHVVGTVRSDVSSTGDFNFTAVSTGGGQYRIYPDDATTANPTWLHQSNSSEDQAWVIGGVERMRITSSGRLGIGTVPDHTLHVQASIASNDLVYLNNTNATESDVLRLNTSGTGSGTTILDVQSGGTSHFLVRGDGKVLQGTTSAITGAGGVVSVNQIAGTTGVSSRSAFVYSATNTAASVYEMGKSANATVGSHTLVDNGETLGTIRWSGSDGTNFIRAAEISGIVNGIPGTNDMPGALTFGTTADGGTSPTEHMRIDSSGNVGIGTANPSQKLSVTSNISATNLYVTSNGDTSTNGISGGFKHGGLSSKSLVIEADPNNVGGSTYIGFNVDGSERMRITSSGNLLVGEASGLLNERIRADFAAGNTGITTSVGSTAQQSHIAFYNGSVVGSISTNGSATAYNTSSDYRLKEDVQPMTGASDRVLSLNPVNFAWKADGTRTDGFIAHEVQEVAPYAVTGEKDGEEMQAMDHSKLVPLLTAALQEALTEIAALKARLAAANL